jgi:uncharacterized protein (DUF433 family)
MFQVSFKSSGAAFDSPLNSGALAPRYTESDREDRLMTFTRITVDARQLGGAPCIRGLRIPVATVVGMVADGMTTPEILDAFPDLENDDVKEALRFAADAVRERELPLASER